MMDKDYKYGTDTYATHIAEGMENERAAHMTCKVCKKTFLDAPDWYVVGGVCDRCTDHGR